MVGSTKTLDELLAETGGSVISPPSPANINRMIAAGADQPRYYNDALASDNALVLIYLTHKDRITPRTVVPGRDCY
jgi:hypothetical protein